MPLVQINPHPLPAAFYEQFVFRFFPPELHWLGHQLIRSLSLPTTLETMQIDPPFPLAKEILPKFLGLIFWHQETQMDDPPRSYIEDRENMSPEDRAKLRAQIKTLDEAFPQHFIPKYKDDPRFAGCPYHAALGAVATGQPKGVPGEVRATERQAGILDRD